MIVLDTHVWFWLVTEPKRLTSAAVAAIDEADVIGIPAISCWEIAMLAERGRIVLGRPTVEWLRAALTGRGPFFCRWSSRSPRLPRACHCTAIPLTG